MATFTKSPTDHCSSKSKRSNPTMTNMTESRRYQRGTPQGPLTLRARTVIMLLLVGIAAILSLCLTATGSYNFAILGAIVGLVGLVYDVSVHSLALAFMMFMTTMSSKLAADDSVDDAVASASMAAGLLLLTFLLSTQDALCEPLERALQVTVFCGIGGVCLLNIVAGIGLLLPQEDIELDVVTLIAIVSAATLILLYMWNDNMTHADLNLLSKKERGVAVSMTIALSIAIMDDVSNELLIALLAIVFVALEVVILASVSDVWYAVGTMQFWMISLDTALGAIYILVPMGLLSWRFCVMYGNDVYKKLLETAFDQDLANDGTTELVQNSVLLLLGIISTMGITWIRSVCPIGLHLFSRAYVHGQPNTGKAAICADWSKTLVAALKTKPSIKLNLVVENAENMNKDSRALLAAVKQGHLILPRTNDTEACDVYKSVFGKPPLWTHGLAPGLAQFSVPPPDQKVALWSIDSSSSSCDEIIAEVQKHGGGSILYLSEKDVMEVVPVLTRKKYIIAALPDVVKDDLPMHLKTDDDDDEQ